MKGKRTPYTPYNRIGESDGGGGGGSAGLAFSAINSLFIIALATGVIVTGVFLGQTRGDVGTLQTQLSNTTIFVPQTISSVDTPARFNETTSNFWTAIVTTQGFCATFANYSVCTLEVFANASYLESPAPVAGTPLTFRVIGAFPVAFPFLNAAATPALGLTAIILDLSTNATLITICNTGPVDIGTDIIFQLLIPEGSPTNTAQNSVIFATSEVQFNYVIPK